MTAGVASNYGGSTAYRASKNPSSVDTDGFIHVGEASKSASASSAAAGHLLGMVDEKGTYTAYTTYGAIQNIFTHQMRSLMEAAHYVSCFISNCCNTAPNALGLFSSQMGVLKNALHGVELFVWAPQVWDACSNAVTIRTSAAVAQAISLVGRAFNAVANTVDFAALFLPLRVSVVLAFQKVNVVVTGIWSSIGLTQAFQELLKSDSEDKKTYNLLRLAENISYLAVSVINMGCLALGMALNTTTPVALMALGLTCTVIRSFYEMKKDPYGTNESRMLNATSLIG